MSINTSFNLIQNKIARAHTEQWPSHDLIEFARHYCGFDRLDQEVQWQIVHASGGELHPQGVRYGYEYGFSHLSQRQCIDLYKVLLAYHTTIEKDPSKALFHVHLFDIEDHIFRQTLQNPQAGEEYRTLLEQEGLVEFSKKVEKVLSKGSRFYDLEPKCDKEIQTIADYQIKKSQIKEQSKGPLKVVKFGLENRRNFIGGVGAVLLGLHAAHQAMEKERVCSLHPLYDKDKTAGRDYEFQGILTHQFEGKIVQTSVYKNNANGEYTLVPDPQFHEIFNIPLKEKVYFDTPVSPYFERYFYFGSASAAFVSLYRGKTGDKSVDIAHCDFFPIAGEVFPLLLSVYDKMRIGVGLSIPKKLVSIHCLEINTCPGQNLKKVGVEASYLPKQIELLGEGLRHADKVLFVSSEFASIVLNHEALVDVSPSLHRENKVIAIRNGVQGQRFDVTNEQVFKALALKRTFDEKGVETTDYVGYRARLKKMLFEAGMIADPHRPLAVFVGRYASEKGIPTLVEMVRESKSQGAQFVTIGVNAGQEDCVAQLKKMQESSHKHCLKVYTTFDEQKTPFVHNGISYGLTMSQVIQAAADFRIVTSVREPCGLVAMEGQCSGALLVSSYIEGLKDICLPVGEKHSIKGDANSICYSNPHDFNQARMAFLQAVKIWNEMSVDEQNGLARRLRNHAIKEYSWFFRDPITHETNGVVTAYHKMYQELGGRVENITEKLKVPSQAPIRFVQNKTGFLGLCERIYNWIKAWIEYLIFGRGRLNVRH